MTQKELIDAWIYENIKEESIRSIEDPKTNRAERPEQACKIGRFDI